MLLIDVGCSGGLPSLWRDKSGIRVIGFDSSIEAIQERQSADPNGKYIYSHVAINEPEETENPSDYLISKTQCYTACHILRNDVPKDPKMYINYLQTQKDPAHAASSTDLWQKNSFIQYYKNLFSSGLKTTESPPPPPVINLDDVIKVNEPAVLKVDTDGSELRVLESFSNGLRSQYLMGINIECQFRGVVSSKSSTFSNIDLFLRSNNFYLWQLEPVRYQRAYFPSHFLTSEPAETARGQVQFANAFYIRLPNSVLAVAEEHEYENLKKGYFLMAEVLGAPDLMVEFLIEAQKRFPDIVIQNELNAISFQYANMAYDTLITKFLNNPKSFYVHANPSRIKNYTRRILNRLLRFLN